MRTPSCRPARPREAGVGSYIAAGATDSFRVGFYDAWAVKLDARGGLGKNRSIVGPSCTIVTITTGKTLDTPAAVTNRKATAVQANATAIDTSAQISTNCPN